MTQQLTVSLIFFYAVGSQVGMARDRTAKASTAEIDSIEVIGHLPFDATALQSIVVGEQSRRLYLYLSWAGRLKIVDVTNGTSPVIAHEYLYPPQPGDRVQAVLGNMAVFTDFPPASPTPHVVSIMSFADPLKPRLVRQFVNVMGFVVNDRGRQMYVVDKDGLWVLLKKPAPDVELQQEYSHQTLYSN